MSVEKSSAIIIAPVAASFATTTVAVQLLTLRIKLALARVPVERLFFLAVVIDMLDPFGKVYRIIEAFASITARHVGRRNSPVTWRPLVTDAVARS